MTQALRLKLNSAALPALYTYFYRFNLYKFDNEPIVCVQLFYYEYLIAMDIHF